jgi:hypothetical protein
MKMCFPKKWHKKFFEYVFRSMTNNDENYIQNEYERFLELLRLRAVIPSLPSCLIALTLQYALSLEDHYFNIFHIAPWICSWKCPLNMKHLPTAVQELNLKVNETKSLDFSTSLFLEDWIHDFRKYRRVTIYVNPNDPLQMSQETLRASLAKKLASKKNHYYEKEHETALEEMTRGLKQRYKANAKLLVYCP